VSKNPLNAADALSIALVILGLIFIYTGINQSQSGYTAIGLIELFLAIVQSYINRM
jgi:hypothetical protein